jgi:hypothetical protein
LTCQKRVKKKDKKMKTVRPLEIADVKPYTIEKKVVAVRLFRSRTDKWLVGKPFSIECHEDGIWAICFEFWTELQELETRTMIADNCDPGEKLFEGFIIKHGSVSYDRRRFDHEHAMVVENSFTPKTLSIECDRGQTVISTRNNDLQILDDLLKPEHVTIYE